MRGSPQGPLRATPHSIKGSGAVIAIKGYAWVSGWYPAATELTVLKKAYSSQKNSLVLDAFEVFEKTRCLSKLPHSYFLYVGVAR